MKIYRSTKCSLKFLTQKKQDQLDFILSEYENLVNQFIDLFWNKTLKKSEILKDVYIIPESWLGGTIRQIAAREAIDMIKASKERDKDKAIKPVHHGKRMQLTAAVCNLTDSKTSTEFDAWLRLTSIGQGIKFSIPIKFHKHFNKLSQKGKLLKSYTISKDTVQFVFEIESGPKKETQTAIGVDTGINALATLSNGKQIGTEIKNKIERINRCKQGSKGQKRARRALKNYIDITAKQVSSEADLLVVENLKNITKNTKKNKNKRTFKRRLNQNMRRVIGAWNVSYWLKRLEQRCQDNRVSFRRVSPYYTSQTCSECGHTDKRNRNRETFKCLSCGHLDNSDLNASRNILNRFLIGPYGADCKAKLATGGV